MCSIGPCNCTLGCALPSGIANGQGILGARCCKGGCPRWPMRRVNICIQINDSTCVELQKGCQSLEDVQAGSCGIDWAWGEKQSSWGRKCRVVNFNTDIQTGGYLRLRLCACNSCSSCTDSDLSSSGPVKNVLLKFEVDGVDYIGDLDIIANNSAEPNIPPFGYVANTCLHVGCFTTGSCCNSDEPTDLTNITQGTEIVFGPVGTRLDLTRILA